MQIVLGHQSIGASLMEPALLWGTWCMLIRAQWLTLRNLLSHRPYGAEMHAEQISQYANIISGKTALTFRTPHSDAYNGVKKSFCGILIPPYFPLSWDVAFGQISHPLKASLRRVPPSYPVNQCLIRRDRLTQKHFIVGLSESVLMDCSLVLRKTDGTRGHCLCNALACMLSHTMHG